MKKRQLTIQYNSIFKDIKAASIRKKHQVKYKELQPVLKQGVWFIRIYDADQPFDNCYCRLILGANKQVEEGNNKILIRSFFQDVVEKIKEYSSVHRHKYNKKNSRDEEALMVRKIEEPFKKSDISIETINGNVFIRNMGYYFGAQNDLF